MKSKSLIFLLLAFVLFNSCQPDSDGPAEYVNPFIGTDGHGHTFPGATLPFGMVQLSPDTRKDSWDGCSGYHYSDQTIIGFSHTHLSGTGVGDYGDIRFMPTVGELQLSPGDEKDTSTGYRSKFSHANETAEAGYYQVFLEDYAINVELTTSERSGIQRYTFPQSQQSTIIIDLLESVTSDEILDAELNFVNDSTVSGFRLTKGWARKQYVFFYAVFSKSMTSFGIQTGGEKHTNAKSMRGKDLVGWARFSTADQEKIMVKVGISAVDIEGAANNLSTELPTWDFDAARIAAKTKWNNALSKIEVNGDNEADKTIFYTALYHTMIAPNLYSDVDGRYRGHDHKIHKVEGDDRYTVFSLWDTFRALHPLFTIIERERTAAMVRTMLDIYDKGGLLPVWELAGNETWCMIGYHAVPVITDAWVNGIRDFDQKKALEAMQKSANADHHGLEWYKNLGFIPADKESESVSKTLEYAYDDWCIATFANTLGEEKIASEFTQRAQFYKNLYDPQTKFFRGRQNGGFIDPFDPAQVNFMLTEANTWQYNFFVLQDINGHIKMMGGETAYENMLDGLFHSEGKLTGRQQSDITGLIGQYAHGNEPSHHMAYLYNYLGKPYKTQELVKQIMDDLYTDKPDGLSGNEDCGQMSAWYVMSAMGFYAVTPGTGKYVIGTPRFSETFLQLENGKSFSIEAKNLDETNFYIQSAQLNGKPYPFSWISNETIMAGGKLVFEMGSKPNPSWGKEIKNRPSQIIDQQLITSVPVIQSISKTFTESLEISMLHPDSNAKIYYTVNGATPDAKSILYTAPFQIRRDASVKAMAVSNGNSVSVVDANFFKIPSDRMLYLETMYDAQYPGGGDNALLDQQRGTADFRTGAWQGYHGKDVIAVVDLGKLTTISTIEIGFLQDQNSWVFLPLWVEFKSSEDGNNYTSVGRVTTTLSPKADGGIIKNYIQTVEIKPVRYVQVVAKNRGVCPEWHIGKGEPAWLFADEIIIK